MEAEGFPQMFHVFAANVRLDLRADEPMPYVESAEWLPVQG
jgi:hypothetical protein